MHLYPSLSCGGIDYSSLSNRNCLFAKNVARGRAEEILTLPLEFRSSEKRTETEKDSQLLSGPLRFEKLMTSLFARCFVHFIFHFWSLLSTKLQKYSVIFVYILHGKMSRTEKTGKKITQLK